jgi:hypothetical protein
MNLQTQYALKKAEIDHVPDIVKQVEPIQAMACTLDAFTEPRTAGLFVSALPKPEPASY